ncbi:MAG: hypothetical protein JO309_02675 [Pseudonocardiales bacterium]|nr:hypothetical protein [Pseudonocardiales bacterium]
MLQGWAASRGHLREITATDVTAAVEPLRGWPRRTTIAALRSLFRSLVFNLSHSAASRYADIVQQLLDDVEKTPRGESAGDRRSVLQGFRGDCLRDLRG